MATLTGQTITTSYEQLLSLPDGGLNGTSLVAITDGDSDTACALQVSTTKVMIEGSGNKLYFHDEGDEHISAAGGDLTIAAGTALNITADIIDLSDATKDITLNGAVDAINFDSNTLSIDASNNRVGIGTASPQYTLDVSIANGGEMVLHRIDGDNSIVNGNKLGAIYFTGLDASTIGLGAKILAASQGTWDTGTDPHKSPTALQFYVEDSSTTDQITAGPQMILNNNGNLGIGTTVFSSGVSVLGILNGTDPGGTTTNTACLLSLSGEMNYTDASGNIATLDSLSDERIKENIALIPDALSRLAKLKGVTFNYVSYKNSTLPFKNDIEDDVTFASHDKYGDSKRVGIIAQDVDEAYDGLSITNSVMNLAVESSVKGSVEDHVPEKYGDVKKVRIETLVPLLIEAVKELSAKVTALESA